MQWASSTRIYPMIPAIVALALSLGFTENPAAIAQEYSPAPEGLSEEDLGAILYNKACAKCHSVGGHGSGSDISFTRSWSAAQLEEAILRMEPTVGPLEPEQVSDLVVLLQDPNAGERLKTARKMSDGAPGGGDAEADPAARASENNAGNGPGAGSGTASQWVIATAPATATTGTTENGKTSETIPGEDLAAMTFMQSCAGCHAVGGNVTLSGPNLASTAKWPAAELEAAVIRMEKFAGPMNQEQVQGLVSLLQDPEAANRLKTQQELKAQKQTASLGKASAGLGEQLFHGEIAFANGGMACAACHAIGSTGGTMGPGLVDAFSRMGQAALQSACEQGNFKVMTAAYRDHKVTAQEALHLTEYLKRVDKEGPATTTGASVPIYGTAGTVAMLATLGFLFRKRNGGSVRRKLVRRR